MLLFSLFSFLPLLSPAFSLSPAADFSDFSDLVDFELLLLLLPLSASSVCGFAVAEVVAPCECALELAPALGLAPVLPPPAPLPVALVELLPLVLVPGVLPPKFCVVVGSGRTDEPPVALELVLAGDVFGDALTLALGEAVALALIVAEGDALMLADGDALIDADAVALGEADGSVEAPLPVVVVVLPP